MKLFWLFDRLRNKIKRKYRHKVFKEMINCSHNDFSIVGDITVINRNIKLTQCYNISECYVLG